MPRRLWHLIAVPLGMGGTPAALLGHDKLVCGILRAKGAAARRALRLLEGCGQAGAMYVRQRKQGGKLCVWDSGVIEPESSNTLWAFASTAVCTRLVNGEPAAAME